MTDLLRELIHLGLSEKEGQVYLSSLELGPAPVQDISHKAKVNRATTYVMIEALSARGLMSTFVRGKKRYYVAETPERLRSILRMQRREIEEKESELDDVMPMLMAMFNVEGAKPQIRYLEGPAGLNMVRELFLSEKGEFVQIVPLDDVLAMDDVLKTQAEHLAQFRSGEAKYRSLITMKDPDEKLIPDVPNGEIRILPASKFPIHGEITIRGNIIHLFSYKSAVLAIVITSQEIADAMRALFDLAWEGASQYPSRKQ